MAKSYYASLGYGSQSTEDFASRTLGELRDFLGSSVIPPSMSDQELLAKCREAGPKIMQEWKDRKINPSNTKQVEQFYKETNLYCYDLIGLEIDAPPARQKQLQDILTTLTQAGLKYGCDYGSGVGTLGIYLNNNGLTCDFADISATNLRFVHARLKRRELRNPKLINLQSEKPQDNHYDFITVFDVFEHVVDPIGLLEELSNKLRVGGYLIFNLLYHDEDNSPHLIKDPNPFRKAIRRYGLSKVGTIGEFKIYKKSARPEWINHLFHLMDRLFWDFRTAIKGR